MLANKLPVVTSGGGSAEAKSTPRLAGFAVGGGWRGR